jgi:hypothetical protein
MPLPERPIDRLLRERELKKKGASNPFLQMLDAPQEAPNPFLAVLDQSTAARAAQLEASQAQRGRREFNNMDLMGGPGQDWTNSYSMLRNQVGTGDLSQEDAKAMMDEIMRKNRVNRGANPFLYGVSP